ncbi:MAG: ABC transporter ATP-binding protein [Acholeplasmatales bacterium]|nr:ABC transporter ATP-binding protein [Acholeplasmatales bacterium]
MIVLRDVNKIYGKGEGAVHALKDANLVIEDGKFTAILGKSGSGKSTLMNIIGALDSPTSGTIESNGVILNELDKNELAKYRNKTTGFVFQSFYLEPTFTVLENVAMPLTIAGMNKKERELKATKIIEELGLSEKINKKASELSGGQKQRVSIARALVHDPDIVLADEPTGNLDSQNGAEVMALLKKIVEKGKSVILVTHNMEDAKNADNIIEIKDGVATAKYMNGKYDNLFEHKTYIVEENNKKEIGESVENKVEEVK